MLRQIATRAVAPTDFTPANKQILSKRRYVARDRITSLKIAFANWYLNSGIEVGSGGILKAKAFVEYAGQKVYFEWSGSPEVLIADFATSEISDAAFIDIPDGSEFYIISLGTFSNGIAYTLDRDKAGGDACQYGLSGLTIDTPIVDTGLYSSFGPILVLGESDKPSVLLVGDSRVDGLYEAVNPFGFRGLTERSIGPHLATLKVASSGEQASEFVSSHARRLELSAYFTKVVICEGINDLRHGRSGEQATQDIATIVSYFPDADVYVCTIDPVSESSDGWASLANQTPDPLTNVGRVLFNENVRAGIPGVAGYFELADVLESGRNSGKWRVAGGAFTDDGLHANRRGNQFLEDYGALEVRVLADLPAWARIASPEALAKGGASNQLVTVGSFSRRPKFSLNKGNVNQDFPANVETVVSYPVAFWNYLGRYDAATHRLYLPAGLYHVSAMVGIVSGMVDQANCVIKIRKNGIRCLANVLNSSGGQPFSNSVSGEFAVNDGDYIDVTIQYAGVGTISLNGSAVYSAFSGFSI